MPLEAATFINDFTATNPDADDFLLQADDHMRLIKSVLKSSFPNVTFAKYLEQVRADVADAATPALWAATTNYANLLGTTTITGFASGTDGQSKIVRFNAIRQLTHHATTLNLPSAANITTAAGDHALITCNGTTANTVLAYFKTNGKAVIETDPIPTIAATDVNKFLQATDDSPKTTAWTFPVPAGAIIAWAAASPPTGWLECNGASLLRTTYPDLFTVIGVTYGAADGTHFYIPDYQGEFLRGMDPGTSRDPDSASRTDRGDGTTGANVGTKQGHQLLLHGHTTRMANSSSAGNDTTGGMMMDNNAPVNHPEFTGTPTNTQGQQVGGAGGNETRPRNVNVKWIIKAH